MTRPTLATAFALSILFGTIGCASPTPLESTNHSGSAEESSTDKEAAAKAMSELLASNDAPSLSVPNNDPSSTIESYAYRGSDSAFTVSEVKSGGSEEGHRVAIMLSADQSSVVGIGFSEGMTGADVQALLESAHAAYQAANAAPAVADLGDDPGNVQPASLHVLGGVDLKCMYLNGYVKDWVMSKVLFWGGFVTMGAGVLSSGVVVGVIGVVGGGGMIVASINLSKTVEDEQWRCTPPG